MAGPSTAIPRATPSSSRRAPNNRRESEAPSSTAQSIATGGGGRVLTLPPYEPQVAELNATGKRALQGFASSTSTRHLRQHLEHAAKALTGNAGEINDRLTDARERCEKRRQRRRDKRAETRAAEGGGGEADGDEGDAEVETAEKDDDEEEEQRRLDELDRRVREATERMEEKVREVVDSEVRIDSLMEILGEIGREDAVPPSLERRTRRTRGDDGEEHENGEGEDGEEDETQEEDEPVVPASRVLDSRLAEKKDHWNGLSLTARYGKRNTYVGFKRMVHDSEHSGDNIPPLPPASTWFSHLEEVADEAETPSRRKRRKQAELDQRRQRVGETVGEGEEGEESEREEHVKSEADDIAINSEKASLQCPITLLRFKDPVTSTKCPHSFERSAIEDMIKRGANRRRGGRQGGGVKGRVQCPVCTVQLTLKDLTTDPVLVRRVRRANEMDAREDDDDDDDNGDEEDNDVMLEAETRRKKRSLPIKTEKTRSPSSERSMVPDTQFETLSDDDDGEDDGNEA